MPLPPYLDAAGDPWVLVSISSQLQDDIPLADAAMKALADRPVRVLVTVGPDHDPAELASVPPNAHVERTASHAAVLERGEDVCAAKQLEVSVWAVRPDFLDDVLEANHGPRCLTLRPSCVWLSVRIADATSEAALLRLRPIMMTALVAALGLLPAAFSSGVGSDSQRPFALVIVGGLFSRLLISVYLMPALYTVAAREGDRLEV